jgi:hypothetical protein
MLERDGVKVFLWFYKCDAYLRGKQNVPDKDVMDGVELTSIIVNHSVNSFGNT